MGRFHLDHFKKKYGWTGKSYRDLMKVIVAHNTEHVAKAVGRVTNENYNRAMKRLSTKSKRFVVPDVSEVLPKRSVFIRKAATRGALLSDSLRTRLDKDLRKALEIASPKTGIPMYITQRGKAAGRINPKIIKQFEENIRQTFAGYTKRDPKVGMPTNIHHIAVTELRSVADDIKYRYAATFNKRNPDVKIRKRWIHNPHLSKAARWIRKTHKAMNGKTVGIDEYFNVRDETTGNINKMLHPHDPSAPPEQVIACHCDVDYYASIKKSKNTKVLKSLGDAVGDMLWIAKAKRDPIGTVKFRPSSNAYFKKIRETGEPSIDWVKLKDVKTDEHGNITNEGSAEDPTANLKFIENESRGLAAKFDTYIDSEEGRVFMAEMGKLFKSGSVHYSEHERRKIAQRVAFFRRKFFEDAGVNEKDKEWIDDAIGKWCASSEAPASLSMQYGIVKMLNEDVRIGKRKRFRHEDEEEDARAAWKFALKNKVESEEGMHKALLTQFAFTRGLLKRLNKDKETLTLIRGIGGGQKNELKSEFEKKDSAWLNLCPLSSWTSDKNLKFNDVRVKAKMPIENCLACFVSHEEVLTQYAESEYIMYAHGLEVKRAHFVGDSSFTVPQKEKKKKTTDDKTTDEKAADGFLKKPFGNYEVIDPMVSSWNDPPDLTKTIASYKSIPFANTDVPVRIDITTKARQVSTRMALSSGENAPDHQNQNPTAGGSRDNYAVINNMPHIKKSDFQIVGDAGGTNGAKFAKVPIEKFYVAGASTDSGMMDVVVKTSNVDFKKNQIQDEYIANRIYRSLGVLTPAATLFTDGDSGDPVFVSAKINSAVSLKDIKNDPARKDDYEQVKKQLQQNFVVDAILGNWDVVGMDYDNVLVGSGNQAFRIDLGGSLRHRAQGKEKGPNGFPAAFPGELNTMRSSQHNATSAEIFGSMTDEDVARQVLEKFATEGSKSFRDIMLTEAHDLCGTDQHLAKTLDARINEAVKWAHGILS